MRVRALLVAALCALAMAFGAVLAGGAGPAQAYPPGICATISVSTTHPAPGATLTVTGASFDPRATVHLVLKTRTYTLATVTTDASGAFSTQVRLPAGVVGNHLIIATGAQTACPADPVQLDIQGAGTQGGGTGNSGNGGLASTGLDVALLVALALGLIGVGVVLNRRRAAPAATRRRR